MKCLHCHREIVLVPSAAERAAKDVTGKSAAYYTGLFQYHEACTLELRKTHMTTLLKGKK